MSHPIGQQLSRGVTTVRVKCLVQEDSTMSLVRALTWTNFKHEATVPFALPMRCPPKSLPSTHKGSVELAPRSHFSCKECQIYMQEHQGILYNATSAFVTWLIVLGPSAFSASLVAPILLARRKVQHIILTFSRNC